MIKMNQIKKKIISWKQLSKIVIEISDDIIKTCYKPDFIVAIQRGGLIPA